MRLSEIESKETRNLLRGLQNKEANSETLSTLNKLLKQVSVSDAGQIVGLLQDSSLYSKLHLPDDFPNEPANFDRHVELELASLPVELSFLRARQEHNVQRLLSALEYFARLLESIAHKELETAMDIVDEIVEKFGFSIRLLLKVAFVYSIADNSSDASKYKGRKATARACTDEVMDLFNSGVGPTEIARRVGIGRASVYRILADQSAKCP